MYIELYIYICIYTYIQLYTYIVCLEIDQKMKDIDLHIDRTPEIWSILEHSGAFWSSRFEG